MAVGGHAPKRSAPPLSCNRRESYIEAVVPPAVMPIGPCRHARQRPGISGHKIGTLRVNTEDARKLGNV